MACFQEVHKAIEIVQKGLPCLYSPTVRAQDGSRSIFKWRKRLICFWKAPSASLVAVILWHQDARPPGGSFYMHLAPQPLLAQTPPESHRTVRIQGSSWQVITPRVLYREMKKHPFYGKEAHFSCSFGLRFSAHTSRGLQRCSQGT